MVLPDNCLFEDKAGEVFKILMQDWPPAHHPAPAARYLHALQPGRQGQRDLLPEGLPHGERLIYDARSNVPGITKKERPLTSAHFEDFEKCYGPNPNGGARRKTRVTRGRFRKFHISEIKDRDYKLDITWLKDESLEDANDLPEPQDLAAEAITELEAVVDDLRDILQ